ncbi:MAG: right-handed parallel beta-helix repeat-containing protein, partial [Victivallales bacterium]
VNIPTGGTAEKPFIFDGRGAVINLLTHYTADKWKDEGAGVYSMPLPNNAHVMDKQWRGFDLVFFDGRAGKNCASREELEPLGYFLFKQRLQIEGKFHPLHNTLYIKLPEGKTAAGIRVEAPGVGTILHCEKPYVTIRNLTVMYCTQDGFASTRAPGIVFEGVRGCFNMDQGISHHGSQVTVRDSRFDHNAGCGIVDVYPEVKVRYERCLIEDDTYRGGVELYSGEFVMEACVIRSNPGKELSVNRPGTRVTLRNCLLIGREGGKDTGIQQGEGMLTLERCTFYRLKTGLVVSPSAVKLSMSRCAFLDCEQNYVILPPGKDAPARDVAIDDNAYEPASFSVGGRVYNPEQWADFQAKTGYDSHSTMRKIDKPLPPWTLPALKGKGREGGDIGASLDPASFRFLKAE